jgi:hypothetical protein
MNESEDPTISEEVAIADTTTLEEEPINPDYERLKLEERKVRTDEDRVEIEKLKAASERHWMNLWVRPLLPVLIAGFLSLAGVKITNILKDKEIEIARVQKDKELAMAQTQREKDRDNLEAQQQREWNLEVAKFVTEHANVIFGGSPEQQRRVANIIKVTFPSQISDALLKKLDATQPQGKSAPLNTWAQARKELTQNDDEAHVFFEVLNELDGSEIPNAHVVFTLAEGGEPSIDTMTGSYGRGSADLPSGVNFRVLITKNSYKPKDELVTYSPGKQHVVFRIGAMP